MMDQDGAFFYLVFGRRSYADNAKGVFKNAVLNRTEGGFGGKKWSSF